MGKECWEIGLDTANHLKKEKKKKSLCMCKSLEASMVRHFPAKIQYQLKIEKNKINTMKKNLKCRIN